MYTGIYYICRTVGNFCRLTTVEQWPSGKYSREATPEKESVCGLVILGAVNKDRVRSNPTMKSPGFQPKEKVKRKVKVMLKSDIFSYLLKSQI